MGRFGSAVRGAALSASTAIVLQVVVGDEETATYLLTVVPLVCLSNRAFNMECNQPGERQVSLVDYIGVASAISLRSFTRLGSVVSIVDFLQLVDFLFLGRLATSVEAPPRSGQERRGFRPSEESAKSHKGFKRVVFVSS